MEAFATTDTDALLVKARPVACQVPGCSADLSTEQKAAYCIKRRLCRQHMQADAVLRKGCDQQILWRFCFQCGKLEPVSCFEAQQRSCKSSLKHRRRVAASSRHRSEDNSNSSGGSAQQQRCSSLPCPLLSGNSSSFTTTGTSVSDWGKPRRRSFAELEAAISRRSTPQHQQQQQQQLSSCFAQEQVQALARFNNMARPDLTESRLPGLERSPSSSWMGSTINTHLAEPVAAPVEQQLHAASSGELNNGSSHGATSAGPGFSAVTAAEELTGAFYSSHEAGAISAASGHGCWTADNAADCSAVDLDAEGLLQQLLGDMEACGLLRPDDSSATGVAALAQPSLAVEAPRAARSLSEAELVALIEQELRAAATAQAFSQQQWPPAHPAPPASLPVASDCKPALAPARPEVELLDDPALEALRAQLGLLHIKSMQLQQLLASAQAAEPVPAGFGGAICLGAQHEMLTFDFAGFMGTC